MSPLWNDDCPESAMTFHGDSVKLECDVTSSPPPDVTVVWHYNNPLATENNEISIRADTPLSETPRHYSMKVEEVSSSS